MEKNVWTDGVFPPIFKVRSDKRRWIVFEGEINAIWVENLNQILDDNKTLLLANGERIPLCPNTVLMFETPNATHASPAFVSRVGTVLVEE